ncbi:sporulation protein YqfD [Hydrogenoanaerobacterium sp.]|uniref:sporulation protein YqfD n=1 Tax=Hydrogenoanaerobacterium sp. TaxID=2953763 RepID=UPI00289682B6|nr:sporulation protein YqfD [Hydrogenoanaerobacterium sp.]
MFIIKIIRYLKGYVRFTATGVFLERFLNMVVRKGVNIWEVKKQDTTLTACTDVRSYKRLRPYAKKTGVRLRVKERHGAPFRVRRYHKRVGLLVGILFFMLFLCAMGQFIWRIEVVGNTEVPTDQILATVNELGLKAGAFKGKLNAREMERTALRRLQRLSWIAVNIDGSTATVEVRERVMPPEMFPDHDVPCNVVAAHTGLITYMEVYEGQSVLKVGDTVKQGEVIVSGIIEDKKGQATYKHARAKVIAQTDYEITVEQPLIKDEKVMIGIQKHRRYLRVFGADLPLFIYRPFKVAYDLKREISPLTLFGIPLPITLIEETYDFYVIEQHPLTPEQAKREAEVILLQKEKEELKETKIVEKTVNDEFLDNLYKLNIKYLCNIDIAKEKEILINQ